MRLWQLSAKRHSSGWGGRYDIGCYEYDSRAGGTGVSLAYDDAGNLTDDGDKGYEYDVLGRLTRVGSSLNSNVSLAAYRYDGLDRLVMEITYDYQDNGTTCYAPLDSTRYFYYDVGPVGAEVAVGGGRRALADELPVPPTPQTGRKDVPCPLGKRTCHPPYGPRRKWAWGQVFPPCASSG